MRKNDYIRKEQAERTVEEQKNCSGAGNGLAGSSRRPPLSWHKPGDSVTVGMRGFVSVLY